MVIENTWGARPLAVQETIDAFGIEAMTLITHDLQSTPPIRAASEREPPS
jgi:hypothetical protein